MSLVIDPDSRQIREFACECCNAQARRTWAEMYDDATDRAVAVYYASCYHHDNGVREAWIDAIVGTWGDTSPEGQAVNDHVTFGCRIGPVADSPEPAASLVNGGEVAPDSPIFGQKLSREEGLTHPRIDEFWTVVDAILEHDDLVREHIYGPAE